MSYGNIYRPPPQPAQGRRYAPIPAQGDQPPPHNVALTMALVLASWPTGLEDRRDQWQGVTLQDVEAAPAAMGYYSTWVAPDPMPQQRRPSAATLPQAEVVEQPAYTRLPRSVLDSWYASTDYVQSRRQVAPLTLTYGDAPPVTSRAGFLSLLDSWREPTHYDLRRPPLVQGEPPPAANDPIPRSRALELSIVQVAWIPPPPQPQRDRKNVAPLTLTYGDQPPPWSPSQLRATLVHAWTPPHHYDVRARGPVTESGLTIEVKTPFVRLSQAILDSWQRLTDHTQRRLPPPPPPVVNDPLPRSLAALFSIIQTHWIPPPPLPHRPVTIAVAAAFVGPGDYVLILNIDRNHALELNIDRGHALTLNIDRAVELTLEK